MGQTQNLQRELDVARDLARTAGDIVMRYYASRNFDVEEKANDFGPVTTADREADQFIAGKLLEAFPKDAVLGEETGVQGPVTRDAEDTLLEAVLGLSLMGWPCARVWMVDPIDGTKEFVRGGDDFAVMIGLVIAGRPRLGVVYRPVLDRMAWGGPEGAFVQTGQGEPQPLAVRARTTSLVAVSSRSHADPRVLAAHDLLDLERAYVHGSYGLKVVEIASQEADVYINLSGRTALWDTAAPQAILEAAGGRLTTRSDDALSYGSKTFYHQDGLIATNCACHDDVLAAVSSGSAST